MNAKNSKLTIPVGPHDHVQGPANAPVTLVEYGDYECPHCGRAYPIIKSMQKRLGNRLRFVFRNLPLAELHPNATAAAELAEAAGMQGKFWEMHDVLFENQRALEPDDLRGYVKKLGLNVGKLEEALAGGAPSDRVRKDFMSAIRSGANGTPTFFINGERYDGSWYDEEEFISVLEAITG
jgi:protein-disulfide isomerase